MRRHLVDLDLGPMKSSPSKTLAPLASEDVDVVAAPGSLLSKPIVNGLSAGTAQRRSGRTRCSGPRADVSPGAPDPPDGPSRPGARRAGGRLAPDGGRHPDEVQGDRSGADERSPSATGARRGQRRSGIVLDVPGPIGVDDLVYSLRASTSQPSRETIVMTTRPRAASRRRRGRRTGPRRRARRGSAGTTGPACGRRAAARRGSTAGSGWWSPASRGRSRRGPRRPSRAASSTSAIDAEHDATPPKTRPQNSRTSRSRRGTGRTTAGHVDAGRRQRRDPALPRRVGPAVANQAIVEPARRTRPR